MKTEGWPRTEQPSPRRKNAILAGVSIFLGVEFLARLVILPTNPTSQDVWVTLAIEWAMFLALMFLWIPRAERLPLTSIGLSRFRLRHLALGAVAYLVSLVLTALLSLLLSSRGLPTLQDMQPLLRSYPLSTLFGLLITGILLEEFLYRGYLIERVGALAHRTWPALLASFVAFTIVRWRFVGLYPMLQIALMSAVLVLLYARERAVWPCCVMHGINSIFVYLLFPLGPRLVVADLRAAAG